MFETQELSSRLLTLKFVSLGFASIDCPVKRKRVVTVKPFDFERLLLS